MEAQVTEETPLDPLQALEQKLCTLLEAKQKEMTERMEQIDAEIQDRIDQIYETNVQNTESIKTLENVIGNLTSILQQKVSVTNFEAHKDSVYKVLECIKGRIKSNEEELQTVNDKCMSNESKLAEHTVEVKNSLAKLDKDIQNVSQSIELTTQKLENYLTRDNFEEYLKTAKADEESLNQRITSLHNNINPHALLKPDNDITVHDKKTLESTPNTFLKYLFDIFHSEAKAVIEKQNEKIRYAESLMDTLKKNLNTNLYIAAKKAVGQLQAKGELCSGFPNDYGFLLDSVQTMVAKKCDASEFQSLNDLKANKTDLESLHAFVEQVNDKLKYTVVMLNEFMGILTSSTKESKAEKVGKLSSVAYQLSLLCKSMTSDQKFETVGEQMDDSLHFEREECGMEENSTEHRLQPTILIRSSPKKVARAKTRVDSYSENKRMRESKMFIDKKEKSYRTTAASYKVSMSRLYPATVDQSLVYGAKETHIRKRSIISRAKREQDSGM